MSKSIGWLYIDSNVYISLKRDSALLYNTFSGEGFEYSKDQVVLSIIKQLKSNTNYYVVSLSQSQYSNPAVKAFLRQIKKYFMGDFIFAGSNSKKPIQLTPMLKVSDHFNDEREQSIISSQKDLVSYLTHLSIYLTDKCSCQCGLGSNASKQFLYCRCLKDNQSELDLDLLIPLLAELEQSSISQINLLGGDIFLYSKLNMLAKHLRNLSAKKSYHIHYKYLLEHLSCLNELNLPNSEICVLVHFPYTESELLKALFALSKQEIPHQIIFVVEKNSQLHVIEDLVTSNKLSQEIIIKPYFNGKNINFFKQNIFIGKKDIFISKPTMKDIQARQIVNPLSFGRLTVLCDGNVYANLNDNPLGSIKDHSINEMLIKEVHYGKTWRRLRKNVKPCQGCMFQSLCPPISNYELVIKRNNLCRIWPEKT